LFSCVHRCPGWIPMVKTNMFCGLAAAAIAQQQRQPW
jgi:hypothetical protein